MYLYSAFITFFLMSVSIPAYAFPVVIGSMASNIFVLLLSVLGVAQSGRKKNIGLMIFFIFLASFFIYQNIQVSELKNLSLEHEYFPVDSEIIPMENVNISDGVSSLNNIRSGNADYIIVSTSKVQYIPGSHIIYFNDFQSISRFSKQTNKPIYVFSNLRSHGVAVLSFLNKIGVKNVSIVDSAFLFNNLSNKMVLSNDVDSIKNIKDIEFQPLNPSYQSLYKYLSSKNKIVITDTNQFKVHSFVDSILLTPIDLASMTNDKWSNISSNLNNKLDTVILFSKDHNEDDIQMMLKYIVLKLNLNPDKVSYSMTYLRKYGFNDLSNDNQITPIFFRSNVWMDSLDVYALPSLVKKNVTIGCFTEQCMERIPPEGSGYISRDLKKYNPFTLDNWKLKSNNIPFDKDEVILLSPEDSNSSLLSYYLAYDLSRKGYDFRGFIKSNNELFGATYFLGKGRNTAESLLIDSTKVNNFLEINKFFKFWSSIKTIETNNLFLFLIGALLGYLAFLGGFFSLVSSAICIWLFSYFSDIFKMPIEEYQYMIANPIILSILFFSYFVSNGLLDFSRNYGNKAIFILCPVFMFIFIIMNMTPTPFDRIYLGFVSFLLVSTIFIKINKSIMYTPSTAGDKYQKTVPFIDKRSLIKKGFIIKPNTKNIPFFARLFFYKKWIIRSNHLATVESSSAGIFDSKITSVKNLPETIKELKLNALTSISIDKVQFWAMPYYNFKLKGVAKSHANESSFSVSYSLDTGDKVTSGFSSNYKTFHRKMKKSYIEKNILSAIEMVEKYYDKPVIIEFGVTKLNAIKILQVRIDDQIHPAFDRKVLSIWRSGHRFAEKIESSYFSPLGRSVLSRLYGSSVVMDHEHVYRVKKASRDFHYMDVEKAFSLMKNVHKNIDENIIKMDFCSFVDMIADIVEPISNCITQFKINRDHDSLSGISFEINEIMSLAGGTIASMDIAEPWSELNLNSVATERDLCKSIMMYAVVLCKFYHDKSGINIDKNLSLDSYIQNRNVEKLLEKEESKDGWIIVDGPIPDKFIGINLIDSIPLNELKDYTLVVKSFPTSNMSIISKLGGIVSRDGSPMSHLAITAKACNIPCRIGIDYFREFSVKL